MSNQEFVTDKKWIVYILECKDGSLYTGVTDDLPRRVEMHNSGKGAKYTRGRGPVTVRYFEECVDHSAALRREAQIKSFTRPQKIALFDRSTEEYEQYEILS